MACITTGNHNLPDVVHLQPSSRSKRCDVPVAICPKDPPRRSHGPNIIVVTQAANLFRDLGVGEKDVVAYILPNAMETVVTLIGASVAGIANPINPLLMQNKLARSCGNQRQGCGHARVPKDGCASKGGGCGGACAQC